MLVKKWCENTKEFQFLIGTVQRVYYESCNEFIPVRWFQFLIGTVQRTTDELISITNQIRFQFLIGTVQHKRKEDSVRFAYVSIPHRYSTTTVFMRFTQYVVTKHSIKYAQKSVSLFSSNCRKACKQALFESTAKTSRDRPTFL